jgi:hypothetical protein
LNESDLHFEQMPRQSLRYKFGLVVVGVAFGILLRLVFPPADLIHGPVHFEPMPEVKDDNSG